MAELSDARYTFWWQNILMAAGFIAFALFSAFTWNDGPDGVDTEPATSGWAITMFVLGTLAFLLALRCLRMGLIVSDDGIVIRNLTRTRRYEWSQVSQFVITGAGSSWCFIAAALSTGQKRRVTTLSPAQFKRSMEPMETIIRQLNARLASRGVQLPARPDESVSDPPRRGRLVGLWLVTIYIMGFAVFSGVMIYESGDRWQGIALALSALGPLAALLITLRQRRRAAVADPPST